MIESFFLPSSKYPSTTTKIHYLYPSQSKSVSLLGVIKRQSLKFTIINFIGTFIGFMSIILVYPLHREAYGFFQALVANATLLIPLLALGVQGFIVQYAPLFAKKKISESLLAFSLYTATAVSLISLTILCILYVIFKDQLAGLFSNFGFIDEHKFHIVILAYLTMYSSIFMSVSNTNFRIVIPDIIYTLMLKITLPIMILCIIKGWIPLDKFHYFIIGYYILVCSALGYYVLRMWNNTSAPNFDKFDRTEYKAMFTFAAFVMLNGLGETLAVRIDQSMLSAMTSTAIVGTFTMILTIVNVIEIPYKAISQISSPVIAKSWANNDLANINKIYRSSSMFGGAVATLLFIILYHSWPDIIAIMPGNKGGITLEIAQSIFLLIGSAKVLDIATGTNSHIMAYCGEYKAHMYTILSMGVINVFLNYFFIGKFGMVGAAAATFIAILLTNTFKYIFVRIKFGLNINLLALLMIFGLGALTVGLFYLIKMPFHPIINLGVRGIAIVIVFVLGIILVDPGKVFKIEGRKSLPSIKAYIPARLYNILSSLLA